MKTWEHTQENDKWKENNCCWLVGHSNQSNRRITDYRCVRGKVTWDGFEGLGGATSPAQAYTVLGGNITNPYNILGANNASLSQNLKVMRQRGFGNIITPTATTGLLTFLGNGFDNRQLDWLGACGFLVASCSTHPSPAPRPGPDKPVSAAAAPTAAVP